LLIARHRYYGWTLVVGLGVITVVVYGTVQLLSWGRYTTTQRRRKPTAIRRALGLGLGRLAGGGASVSVSARNHSGRPG